MNSATQQETQSPPLGMTWWNIWGGLQFIGGFFVPVYFHRQMEGWIWLYILFHIVLSLTLLAKNRWAFIIATVLNSIYLRNRWDHPQVIEQDHRRETSSTSKRVDERTLYAQVLDEIESGNIDRGLWAKTFAECNGDENRTQAKYLAYRVKEFKRI
jgi:hypothetical protein